MRTECIAPFVQIHLCARTVPAHDQMIREAGVHTARINSRNRHRVGRQRRRRRNLQIITGRRLIVAGHSLQKRAQIDGIRKTVQQRMFGGRRKSQSGRELKRIVDAVADVQHRVGAHVAVATAVAGIMVMMMVHHGAVHRGSVQLRVELQVLFVFENDAKGGVLQHLVLFIGIGLAGVIVRMRFDVAGVLVATFAGRVHVHLGGHHRLVGVMDDEVIIGPVHIVRSVHASLASF